MLTDKEQSKDKSSFIIVCLRNLFFPHLLFLILCFFVLRKKKRRHNTITTKNISHLKKLIQRIFYFKTEQTFMCFAISDPAT